MIINALNSGAKVFMADFEDSLTPTWESVMDGQVNLRDYADGTISYTSPGRGKAYALTTPRKSPCRYRASARLASGVKNIYSSTASRCRARWSISASIFTFNAKKLLAGGAGPYFYLPKLESHEEAQLWADIFAFSEHALGLTKGTIKGHRADRNDLLPVPEDG